MSSEMVVQNLSVQIVNQSWIDYAFALHTVLTTGRVTFLVKPTVNIHSWDVIVGHLIADILKKSEQKCDI